MSSSNLTDHPGETTPLTGSNAASSGSSYKVHVKPESSRRLVTVCILMTELCERLTYYSINANLLIFLKNQLKYDNVTATVITYLFTGTCYLVPVIGGWVADSLSGRFNAIFGSGLIYTVGSIILPAVAFDYQGASSNSQLGLSLGEMQGFFLTGLFLVAIGTGGIKANVGPFGAQQLEDLGSDAVQSFFNWFYWFINLGSAVSFSIVAYIQQEISFFWGYLIPAVSLILANVIFFVAKNKYKAHDPGESVLATTVSIIKEGVQKKRHSPEVLDSYLDYAKYSNGGSYTTEAVEGVKMLGRVIPIFIAMIMYWTIYSQMQSTYLLQGTHMKLGFSDDDFKIPAASLNLFNVAIILILVPIMDRIVYPLLARVKIYPSQLVRIGIGMVLATLSVVVAGFVEVARRDELQVYGGIVQTISNVQYNASSISIFWQVPQFTLIGASEVFASISGLEFAYSQAPAVLQGLIMGMFLLTNGLGNYLGSALIAIVNAATVDDPWYPNDINQGHLEYFFWLLAGLMVLNTLVFVVLAWRYKPADTEMPTFGDYQKKYDLLPGDDYEPVKHNFQEEADLHHSKHATHSTDV
ncbi:solute carrier family 15 member 4 [Lingula anatina]|uniref:Solute carrier family 15 member 4 n=1 Tax=Lingula anatina TaxID=7574 RepID=A0A1S3I568_LINAN|nr:solute carrier family 15 member 4 [Lingula anatina]|eukprot:XP_013392509.1 solute carrier family 15 member 4 [Lingula anatina]